MSLLLLALLSALTWCLLPGAAPVGAQPADEPWYTLRADGFRIHFPGTSEAWTRRVASRLVAVRERLAEEVGYRPPQVIDVVIADPLSRPNGSAWPLLGAPRMVLWTTPPEPTSILGTYRDWGELVSVHEQAHLVHLLRPSRRPWRRIAAQLLPLGGLGPISLRAPRWVTEGYATLLEGRLTPAGRPNSDLVAAVLRTRALAGRLPSYGALGSGDRSWLGRSMAYLVGSAYLAWLEEREGPESLRDLWARMTARKSRSFEEAFRGVYGASPAELYGEFTVELTWRAVEARRRRTGEDGAGASGELWLERSWRTGAPVLSPDGERLAVVLRESPEAGRPPRLVVFPTADDPEADERRRRTSERLLELDPQDVPAVPPEAPEREPLAVLPTLHGRAPASPRWTADGRSIVYTAPGPDAAGYLRLDLFRWTPGNGAPDRITHGADLRSADPARSASTRGEDSWAVAVRHRHGLSQLVRVELGTGEVRPLTEARADTVWASPRLSPDDRRVVAVRNRGDRWRLVLFAVDEGGLRELGELPRGGRPDDAGPWRTVADPAWSADGKTLYAALGAAGFVELAAFDLGDVAGIEPPRILTRSTGAALAPEPNPEGTALFFLALDDDGFDLRRLALEGEGWDRVAGPGDGVAGSAITLGLVPPLGRSPGGVDEPIQAPPRTEPAELPEASAYRLGPREQVPLLGFALSPAGRAFEAGIAGSDPVGRLDWLLLGSAAKDGETMGAVAGLQFRALPVRQSIHLFAAASDPSAQDEPERLAPDARSGALDVDFWGLAAERRWRRRWAPGSLELGLGLVAGQVDGGSAEAAGGTVETGWTRLATRFHLTPSRGRWQGLLGVGASFEEGETDGDFWSRYRTALTVGLSRGEQGLEARWIRRGSDDVRFPFDRHRVGGPRRSVLPPLADAARMPVAALPAGSLVADEVEGQIIELRPGGLPAGAALVWQRYRGWNDGQSRDEWIELAGCELDVELPAAPLLGLPGARVTVGAAYGLAGPWEEEVELWAAIAWRP